MFNLPTVSAIMFIHIEYVPVFKNLRTFLEQINHMILNNIKYININIVLSRLQWTIGVRFLEEEFTVPKISPSHCPDVYRLSVSPHVIASYVFSWDRNLVGNPSAKPLARPRRRWELDYRQVYCEDEKWIDLAKDGVRWRALALSVVDLWFQLPGRQLNS